VKSGCVTLALETYLGIPTVPRDASEEWVRDFGSVELPRDPDGASGIE
jgi:hypothetical protein